MKLESPDFTALNVEAFLAEMLDHERHRLADRLEADSARLAALVQAGVHDRRDGDAWSGQQVLAHIVVLSKFYGMLTSQVGAGKLTEVDLLGAAQARDVAADPLLTLPPEKLLSLAQRDHQRTVAYLRNTNGMDLARRANVLGSFTLSAQEIATLPLCAHLELHLEQLEGAQRS